MDNMIITSSEQKYYLGRSGKGLITSLGINTNVRPKKYKKARYAITNVSMNDLSKIIKEFKNYLIRVVYRRVPNMNPLTLTFA